jgi:hypothetical protein
MDAIRTAEAPESDSALIGSSDGEAGSKKKMELFAQIAVGEAP